MQSILSRTSKKGDGYRGLWVAVVLQALEDVNTESYHSVDYVQSVAFFCGEGPWRQWRQDVAEMLDLHGDDLARVGRAAIAARELRKPPPVAPVVVRQPCPAPAVPGRVAERPVPVRGGHRPVPVDRTGAWLRDFINSGFRAA